MIDRLQVIETMKINAPIFKERYSLTSLEIFGSVAQQGDSSPNDVDFLITYQKGFSAYDLIDLHDELESLLKCPVDVISKKALKPRFKDGLSSEFTSNIEYYLIAV